MELSAEEELVVQLVVVLVLVLAWTAGVWGCVTPGCVRAPSR